MGLTFPILNIKIEDSTIQICDQSLFYLIVVFYKYSIMFIFKKIQYSFVTSLMSLITHVGLIKICWKISLYSILIKVFQSLIFDYKDNEALSLKQTILDKPVQIQQLDQLVHRHSFHYLI